MKNALKVNNSTVAKRMEGIAIIKGSCHDFGHCTNCNGQSKVNVVEIIIGQLAFRLCDDCVETLTSFLNNLK